MSNLFLSLDDFDYSIDAEKIATFPIVPRHNSKLLVYKNKIEEDIFLNLVSHLPQHSQLIFNNTKTIPARLHFTDGTQTIEIFCLSSTDGKTIESVLQNVHTVSLQVYIGHFKKWKSPFLIKKFIHEETEVELLAHKPNEAPHNSVFTLTLSWNKNISLQNILHSVGIIPIPPYLKRNTQVSDAEQYQTVFSTQEGSVATPTAGLHFTPEVFEQLKTKNMATQFLTLHVGADTFKPIEKKNILEHQMHGEFFSVSKNFLQKLVTHQGANIAVGTTSLRTLESLYWLGVKIQQGKATFLQTAFSLEQNDTNDLSDTSLYFVESIEQILVAMEKQQVEELSCWTKLMITPTYKIKSVRALITNFHQPKSSLLLIIQSIVGEKWKMIYDYALKNNFRCFSFGDACLLFVQE